MFKHILLASDGSEHSLRAGKKAVDLACGVTNSKVEVVYVVDGGASKADVLHNLDKTQILLNRKRKLKATEDLLRAAKVPYTTKILHGEPGPTIVKYANENKCDVVVIGSRGLNSLQEMVLGSVSHKVAKRANCPVLIVK